MKCPKCQRTSWKRLERGVNVCVNCGMDDIPRVRPAIVPVKEVKKND